VAVFIPNQLLDRILAETDIVELVSSYFPLKKSGRNFKALCPFHTEKTPSFMVSREKQMFKCFGCGKGGTALHFLMEKEGVTFQEAVRMLADKANIPLPERRSSPKEKETREEMFAAVAFAVSYFQEQVAKPSGEAARSYLQERGVSSGSIEKFHLGYAPDAWDGLLNRASRKFKPSLLERLGLILPRERATGYYDRFRNRIMFPIFDPRGRAIGFSGRTMPDEKDPETPKYVNSPESPLFNKSEILYGLNLSRGNIARENRAIVCEGHMDLIAIDQAGFGNAVAAQGTSFTLSQARLLKRYCSEVIFAFDSDSAGQEATLRSFDPLLEAELDVRVAVVPEGYDPDSLIRQKGAAAFGALLDGSVELVDFQYDVLKKKHDTGTLAGRRAVASQMLMTARRSPSDIVSNAWVQKIGKALDIPEATLRAEMRRIRGNYRPFASGGSGTSLKDKVRENFAVQESQRDLIGYMLAYPQIRDLVKERLEVEDFDDPACRSAAKRILSASRKDGKIKAEALLKEVEETQEAELIARFVMEPVVSEKPLEAAEGLIQRILKPKQVQKRKQLQEMLARADKEGGDRASLQMQHEQLCKEDLRYRNGLHKR
jgi:DNA primase